MILGGLRVGQLGLGFDCVMLRKNSKKRGEGNGADGGEGLVVVPHSDSLSGKGLHNSDSIPVKKGSNTDRPKAKGKKKEKQYAKVRREEKGM